jgi:hypothetical protein
MDSGSVEWATTKLKAYADAVEQYRRYGSADRFSEALALTVPVSRITEHVGLGPLSTGVDHTTLQTNREKALRAVGAWADAADVEQHLGPAAPHLSAGGLHIWVWGAAQQFWESGHCREAVHAAAKSINGRVQALVGRRDVADNDLMKQALSPADPKPGTARLRIPGDHTTAIVRGQQEALMGYAAGCFGVIRNRAAHDEDEWDEQFALERLAALSVLAHEIEQTTVAASAE